MKGAMRKKGLCLTLTAGMLFTCFGCGKGQGPLDLMDQMNRGSNLDEVGGNGGDNRGYGGSVSQGQEDSADTETAMTDFGVRLLQQCIDDENGNLLVSPLSVLTALIMTANGAKGETLTQMENVFGAGTSELSAYLSAYGENLPEAEKYKLSMANSIWFTEDERFSVEQSFLKANEEYFNAGLYQVPFDDSTVKAINSWVKENTDGMIEEILQEIPQDAVMYLINALAFDAEWQNVYEKQDVRDGDFTMEDGNVRRTELMYSSEYQYLEDDSAEGFLKYYAEGKYAFAALLPAEDVTVGEYVSSLTGEGLHEVLTNPVDVKVMAAIPKFRSEYSVIMNDILCRMGMPAAFDIGRADFTGIGHSEAGNLFISKVIHKTYIEVDELGTKAGAVTVVETNDGCAWIEDPEPVKTVYLNRPFVYLIIDCENCLPIFMGVVMETDS